ncbi:alpha,alpha-trehalose-phosphate synthase (UDP-forming) [Derxia lacustris]|uniref:alpha,alpha-trehalose-phosphate synthase (UDP-forming) n=1 Tax=Derxia lacustris TaxID=764842 RepID=UPI000A16D56B|nr:trehalose-6-phosphate synthase [Derxia lacustris]
MAARHLPTPVAAGPRARDRSFLRTFRLSLRFIVPLAVALGLFAYAVVPLVDRLMFGWAIRDIEARSQLIASTLDEQIGDAARDGALGRISRVLERATHDERLYAVAYCNSDGRLLVRTSQFPAGFDCSTRHVDAAVLADARPGSIEALHVLQRPVLAEGETIGALVLVHDTSYVLRRSEETRRYVVLLVAGMGAIVALITVLVAHLSWRGWVDGARAFLRGEGLVRPFENTDPDIAPLVSDMRRLLRQVNEERRILQDTTIEWRPETLRLLLREHLYGDQVIVVSNREPYIHSRADDGSIVVKRPASGLVTAVEPVMRACSGTWIAHGSGSADADVTDRQGHVPVPPDNPSYTLRRLWLTEEEERGYYFGFANEGLWPLCHIAHVRPIFRESDYEQYLAVNKRFADAVVAEARTRDPVVLVQDYHFALLPKLIRERLPQATIITFWHIPWPNPESFGICPWRTEILEGLLGSTILGFHTPYHCQNFLQAVDRFLEARITREDSVVTFHGRRTKVQDYPISIHWEALSPEQRQAAVVARERIRAGYGFADGHCFALGVDRLDYTKGIVERFHAVEAMLAKHPEMIGRFTLVQIAAPSRSILDDYRNFEQRVREQAARINERFARPGQAEAIRLLVEQHSSESVFAHFRACDVCVVTSLHDGMNLVSKEFIAARDDEQGVLILSQFAGAAAELPEALIVNPYHVDQTADVLYQAATMHPAEQAERMRSLRGIVEDFNIYRWAGRMLLDASRERNSAKTRDRIDRLSSSSERY